LTQNNVVITLARRVPRRATPERIKGKNKKKRWQIHRAESWRLEPEDRILLAQLDEGRVDYDPNSPTPAIIIPPRPAGAGRPGSSLTAGARTPSEMPPFPRRFVLRPEIQATLVEKLCKTGRCRLRRTEDEMNPPALRWDDGRPWRFVIDVKVADAAARRWTWRGALRREDDRMDLAEPLVLLPGLVIQGIGRAARFDDGGVFLWMARLRHEKEMALPESQQDTMLGRILGEARVPPTELVEGLELQEVDLPPVPCLTVRAPMQARGTDMLIADVEFDYDGARVASFPPGRMAVQSGRRRVIRRDVRAEARAKERLTELGFRPLNDYRFDPGTLEVSPKKVLQSTRDLVSDGWRVEADGVLYRPASDFKLAVTSGMDWFELDGRVSFGSQEIPLPDLLDAARRGETTISLGDGSIGMLPEDWLRQYGLLADLGTSTDAGVLRFSRSQAGLLDSLLAAQPGSRTDAGFAKVREELRAFEGVAATDAPPGFQGELRPYQREGLGWLEYLRRFGFGGILADDMGLGKTVQVLALLQRLRFKRQLKGPSLIVVPRSLVFNWMQEAARFTPRLRVLDYTGTNRHALRERFDNYDLIVTTYGTVRSDIAELCSIEFEYAILDEAQAIKNSDSQSAKAARLLKARHRLAMSGTPIENHLGELWSIFEFLNPGMLGTAGVFKRTASGASGQDEQARKLLARALRPFILRRTKQQVVKDLPDKIEQTLYCDMEPPQRKLYDDLLAHYRTTLLRKDADELRTSKIEVLEALLRLRQASCHPGLIDPEKSAEPSTKLDMLLPQIAEVVDEGHKVLVFSQFTSFLAIVRQRLDEEKLVYEYLDGKTRDRQQRVDRFQTDPECPIFLISLKAGGLGLNLTAAEYVYLLDPWWNPAVETQAIDRSHRIGQTHTVFAYRLIARDTVEQKILDLQQKKRDLADAILNADNRLIQALTKDDLEFLLS
jgi:superfamily II DNA or RNA helicase